MTADALSLGPAQGNVEQMPFASEPKAAKW